MVTIGCTTYYIYNTDFNPFVHNVVKWLNILQKSGVVHNVRFFKYVRPFYNIIHERVSQ